MDTSLRRSSYKAMMKTRIPARTLEKQPSRQCTFAVNIACYELLHKLVSNRKNVGHKKMLRGWMDTLDRPDHYKT